MIAIETDKITKKFSAGKIVALDEVSLSVEEGIIFGLLGPNGAGKTTLVKILLSVLFATSGSARILGQPIRRVKVREQIGYLPENHRYPDFLKGGEALDYFAKLSGVKKKMRARNKAHLLKLVNMEKWENTRLKKYSKGMLQRIGLAQAMMNDPVILFLDEPTDGVDPIGRKEIRDILLHLKEEGKTIFLNSHMLSEVEMICDEVAILDNGQLIRRSTVSELTSPSKTYRVETSDIPESVMATLQQRSQHFEKHNGFIQFTVPDHKKLNNIIDILRENNIDIKSVIPHKHSLEESFIKIVKHEIDL